MQTSPLRYSATITITRNDEEIDLSVSGIVTNENGRLHLRDLQTSPLASRELTEAENERAETAVIERALSYPESGQSVERENPVNHADLCGWFRAGRAAGVNGRKFELPSTEGEARRQAWANGYRVMRAP